MRTDFTLTRPGAAGSIVFYGNPTEQHRSELLELLGRDQHALQSMLDPEEIARVEYDEDEKETIVVFKRPARNGSDANTFASNSVGLYLLADRLIVITADAVPPAGIERASRAQSLHEAMLILLFECTQEYQTDLRAIKRRSQEIQLMINAAMENHHLLEMLALSESLIYQIDAIDANSTTLAKLRNLSGRLGMGEAELDLLDDIIVDNKQVSRQGHLYATVLTGLMDARGNIINNNMNVLLKNLTIINVVFLPLSVIASMGGMSEFSGALDRIGLLWWEGYLIFAVCMASLGIGLWFLIGRWINHSTRSANRFGHK